MMKQFADEDMIRNAVGDDETEKMLIPPYTEANKGHPLWPKVQAALREVYDPEIPVNIVDLGLVYSMDIVPLEAGAGYGVNVAMTLTAPGCGMGPVLAQDVQNKLVSLEEIDEADVQLVWDPPWNQSMMTEAAKLQLGLL